MNGALMQLDPTPKSYCDCWSYGKSQKSTSECKCGDEDSRELEWVWRPSEHPTVKVTDEVSVMFHPVYSQGTGIVSSMTVKCLYSYNLNPTSFPFCRCEATVHCRLAATTSGRSK